MSAVKKRREVRHGQRQKNLRATGRAPVLRAESRTRSADRVRQIAASIRRSGFTGPVLFAGGNTGIAGAGPCAADAGDGHGSPCIRLPGPVCGSMQGWSAGRQAGRGVTGEVGDVRSARAQLTADQGRLPPWQYPFPAP